MRDSVCVSGGGGGGGTKRGGVEAKEHNHESTLIPICPRNGPS